MQSVQFHAMPDAPLGLGQAALEQIRARPSANLKARAQVLGQRGAAKWPGRPDLLPASRPEWAEL